MSWVHDFFDLRYADIALSQAPDEAMIDGLMARLALSPGDRALDQCCGVGRLSIPLARRGVAVVGVDVIPAYVARAEARAEGLPARFVAADAAAFVPDAPVDAALCWWTSFGYAPDDAGNRALLARAFEALRPGGLYAVETHNVPSLLRQPTPRFEQVLGGVRVVRDSELDLRRGLFAQRWTFHPPEGDSWTRYGTTRLYMPHRIAEMMAEVGFEDVAVMADLSGAPLRLEHPRVLVLGRRPA
ncbi:MAG: methyltransferase domain-containing protein [Alphaproteobacteria bacterium]|nr:methyltransferase domain-containing protein [Alphaproteobacteria bacterium]